MIEVTLAGKHAGQTQAWILCRLKFPKGRDTRND